MKIWQFKGKVMPSGHIDTYKKIRTLKKWWKSEIDNNLGSGTIILYLMCTLWSGIRTAVRWRLRPSCYVDMVPRTCQWTYRTMRNLTCNVHRVYDIGCGKFLHTSSIVHIFTVMWRSHPSSVASRLRLACNIPLGVLNTTQKKNLQFYRYISRKVVWGGVCSYT